MMAGSEQSAPSTMDASPVSNRVKPARPSSTKRSVARDLVIAHRESGASIAECAKAAGVSVNTAQRYIALWHKESDTGSREGVISMLSARLASKSLPDQYIAPLVAILSKLRGWTDREQQAEAVKPMGDLFAAWAAETASVPRGTSETARDSRDTRVRLAETVSETRSGVSDANMNAGEPPTSGVDGGVKSSPPAPQKF